MIPYSHVYMYALAMMPLIVRLDEQALVTQVWFADDATANCKINKIREWWNILNNIGPGYGYYHRLKIMADSRR